MSCTLKPRYISTPCSRYWLQPGGTAAAGGVRAAVQGEAKLMWRHISTPCSRYWLHSGSRRGRRLERVQSDMAALAALPTPEDDVIQGQRPSSATSSNTPRLRLPLPKYDVVQGQCGRRADGSRLLPTRCHVEREAALQRARGNGGHTEEMWKTEKQRAEAESHGAGGRGSWSSAATRPAGRAKSPPPKATKQVAPNPTPAAFPSPLPPSSLLTWRCAS